MEVNSEINKRNFKGCGTRSQIRVGLRGNEGEVDKMYKNISQIVLFLHALTHFLSLAL